MRLLLWLSCLYVLLLSVRPCCADEVCASITKLEQAHTTGKPLKSCAGCSPFFSCGTCTGFVVAKPVVHSLDAIHSEIKPSLLPSYLQPYMQEASHSIWQPPQLG